MDEDTNTKKKLSPFRIIAGILILFFLGIVIGAFIKTVRNGVSEVTRKAADSRANADHQAHYDEPVVEGKDYQISLTADGFKPDHLSLKEYDTLTFINNDSVPHQLKETGKKSNSPQGFFDSGIVKPGQSTTAIFTRRQDGIVIQTKEDPIQTFTVNVADPK